MPLRRDGQLRKRWRYVGVFGEELMLCAARAQVGPLGQCFWVLWDRRARRRYANASLRPGSREVAMAGASVEIRSAQLRAGLTLGQGTPVETICPSGSSWGWTRKRAGVRAQGSVELGGRRLELSGRAVDDESAGYHSRRTSWHWSAGVGSTADGRDVAWNLVEGINDPERKSERTVWLDGVPSEPAPVSFRGLSEVGFAGGEALRFEGECEWARDDNFLLVRSDYRHLFGTFAGALGELELAEGFGVMEEHRALW
jgi:hypothetical protein